jgi:hypothetical protein
MNRGLKRPSRFTKAKSRFAQLLINVFNFFCIATKSLSDIISHNKVNNVYTDAFQKFCNVAGAACLLSIKNNNTAKRSKLVYIMRRAKLTSVLSLAIKLARVRAAATAKSTFQYNCYSSSKNRTRLSDVAF